MSVMKRTPRIRRPPKKDYDTPRQLIALVKEEPIIWDDQYPGHHDGNAREQAWVRIASRFHGLTAKECQNIWFKIKRSRANNKTRKAKKERSGIPRKRKAVPFVYEDEMSFLSSHKQRDVQESNLSPLKEIQNSQPNSADEGEDDTSGSPVHYDKEIVDDENFKAQPDVNGNLLDVEDEMSGVDKSMLDQFEDDCNRAAMVKKGIHPSKSVRNPFALLQSSPVPSGNIQGNGDGGSDNVPQKNKDDIFNDFGVFDNYHDENENFNDENENFNNENEKFNDENKNPGNFEPSPMKKAPKVKKRNAQVPKTKENKKAVNNELGGKGKEIRHKPKNNVAGPQKKRKKEEEPLSSEQSETDEDDIAEYVQTCLRNKEQDKVKAGVAKQEALHTVREERRRTIEAKIAKAKKAEAFYKRDNQNSPLEVVVADHLLRLNDSQEEDSFMHFCLLLAPRLKALPWEDSSRLTSKYMRLLLEAEAQQHIHKPKRVSEKNCNCDSTAKKPYSSLTPEIEAEVVVILESPSEEVIVSDFNLNILGEDMHIIAKPDWLNDKIINFYLELIMERSVNYGGKRIYCFNTFFLSNLRNHGYDHIALWTKKVDLFSFDRILVPVHDLNHWCLVCIDLGRKEITYFDSFKRKNGLHKSSLTKLLKYLQDEMLNKKQCIFDTSDFKKEPVGEMPKQTNGVDCGVFLCAAAECLAREAEMNFTEADMTQIRKKMIFEIANSKLLD